MGYQAETQTKHTQLIDEGEACLVLNMILSKYISNNFQMFMQLGSKVTTRPCKYHNEMIQFLNVMFQH